MELTRRTPATASTAAGSPRTVLVVVENVEERRLVERALRQEGSLVPRVTGSIAEARAVLAVETPTAVLLDADLPNGDASAFLRALVGDGVGPVVVLTGAESLDAALQAMRSGAADFVGKAAGFAELVAPVVTRAVATEQMNRASRDQRARIDALVALNELKNDFLARISHELRTPLTYVMGYAELLHTRQIDPAQVQEMAGDILLEARHLAYLVDTLLAMTEHERGGYHPEPAALGLAEAVDQAWERVTARGGHQLDNRVSPEHVVCADPRMFGQTLTALLDNAVRYGPEAGGTVRVEAKALDDGVCLSVHDQGIGFEPGLAERLFEPLFRVEGDHTHRVRGLGLALATVREIVRAHKGWITAHSDGPGKGARFDLWLPSGCQHHGPGENGAMVS